MKPGPPTPCQFGLYKSLFDLFEHVIGHTVSRTNNIIIRSGFIIYIFFSTVQLAEVVKLGAMSLGSSNPEPQVMLLHAARDVASALRDLTHATKGASGKQVAHPDMDKLKQSAKVCFGNGFRFFLIKSALLINVKWSREAKHYVNDLDLPMVQIF